MTSQPIITKTGAARLPVIPRHATVQAGRSTADGTTRGHGQMQSNANCRQDQPPDVAATVAGTAERRRTGRTVARDEDEALNAR